MVQNTFLKIVIKAKLKRVSNIHVSIFIGESKSVGYGGVESNKRVEARDVWYRWGRI